MGGPTVRDLLVTPSGKRAYESPRIDTKHTHGTGCTLASACATGLAQSLSLEAATARAWDYVHQAMLLAPGLGRGHGPLDHGWPLRGKA
jgi:hydroxymethylpyrimidine/phosphomethylpyrimidine kinase